MSAADDRRDDAQGPGLREAGQQTLATALDIARTRIELLTLDLEEERLRLARLCLSALLTVLLLFIGLMLSLAWIVFLCDPAYRAWALGGLSGLFLLTALGCGVYWRQQMRQRPPLLAATLAELAKDGAALRGNWREGAAP